MVILSDFLWRRRSRMVFRPVMTSDVSRGSRAWWGALMCRRFCIRLASRNERIHGRVSIILTKTGRRREWVCLLACDLFVQEQPVWKRQENHRKTDRVIQRLVERPSARFGCVTLEKSRESTSGAFHRSWSQGFIHLAQHIWVRLLVFILTNTVAACVQ